MFNSNSLCDYVIRIKYNLSIVNNKDQGANF